MSNKTEVKSIVSKNEELKEFLFTRGFFFTTDFSIKANEYPFYNRWKEYKVNSFLLLADNKINVFKFEMADKTFLLIGHAYNPFDNIFDEMQLLNNLYNSRNFFDYFNQWTGVFTLIIIRKENVMVFGDCAGMQSAYYGIIDNNIYISSHSQLIGDICDLTMSQYVKKLISYKFWQMYGLFLPGDISQFDEVYRLVPNTFLSIERSTFKTQVKRFYPKENVDIADTEEKYNCVIKEIGKILYNNMNLISKKWNHPAISMTGGMDSKATLACANGLYDKFRYYSYDSMYGDKPDAEAASLIAKSIGVNHDTYIISENDNDFENLSEITKIMEHNLGDIGKVNSNDVRKRIYFMNTNKFDVEVKSWVSEVGRANYYKKFGKKKMPKKLSPRQMTSMYKFFSYNRKTAVETDEIFKEYIKKIDFYDIKNLDSSDMYLWEFRYGSWGGMVITSEHRVSYDITIPYNNRKLMELFLSLPLEKRISDAPHYDLIKYMNPVIDRVGITVTNYNETKKRMYLEKIYYDLNNLLPF